jgi:hypothetical protein
VQGPGHPGQPGEQRAVEGGVEGDLRVDVDARGLQPRPVVRVAQRPVVGRVQLDVVAAEVDDPVDDLAQRVPDLGEVLFRASVDGPGDLVPPVATVVAGGRQRKFRPNVGVLNQEGILGRPVAQSLGGRDAPGDGVVGRRVAAGRGVLAAAPAQAPGVAGDLVEAVEEVRRVGPVRAAQSVMTSTPASCWSLMASSTAASSTGSSTTGASPGSRDAARRASGERSRLPTVSARVLASRGFMSILR